MLFFLWLLLRFFFLSWCSFIYVFPPQSLCSFFVCLFVLDLWGCFFFHLIWKNFSHYFFKNFFVSSSLLPVLGTSNTCMIGQFKLLHNSLMDCFFTEKQSTICFLFVCFWMFCFCVSGTLISFFARFNLLIHLGYLSS